MKTGAKNSEEEAAVARLTLRQALRKLSPRQRDAYLYCKILGFTEAEAGRILGTPQRTTHDRLHASIKSLKNILVPSA